MIPRDYQVRALEEVWTAIGTKRNVLITAPCSAGKTFLFSKIIQRLLRENPAFRCLILVDREILVSQSADKLRSIAPELGLSIGIVCASVSAVKDATRSVTVASRQSLAGQLDKCPPFQLVIVDEAHLMAIPHDGDPERDQFAEILTRLWDYNPKMRLIGCTASPYRLGTRGGYIYGDRNHEDAQPYFTAADAVITTEELLAGGHIAPLVGRVNVGAEIRSDLSRVAMVAGEFNLGQLSDVMCRKIHIDSCVDAWQRYASERKKTLIFCATIEHAEAVAEAFATAGVQAAAIHSKLSPVDLQINMLALQQGTIPVFTSVAKLTTGMDVVDIDCIIMARPTKSTALYQQCLDAQTEVLTSDGWLGIDDKFDNTKIAQFQPDDRTVTFACGNKIERQLGQEKMYGISSPHLDIRVTAGHRVFFSQRTRVNGFRIHSKLKAITAMELHGEFTLPVAGNMQNPEMPIADCDLTFMGLLLTDGNLSKNNNSIRLSQSEKNHEVIDLINKTLTECKFKFGHSITIGDSNYGKRSPLHSWSISKGAPRGTGKDLTGWGRLEAWVGVDGKTMSSPLKQISTRQVDVLLQAMMAGNGGKFKPAGWVKNSFSLTLANRQLASDIQSLLVVHGYLCNISNHNNGSPAEVIHFSKKENWSVKTSSTDNRAVWGEIQAQPEERVWCVSVPSGAIITRRNGKVAVLGNCIGRGQRLAPGKEDCLVIDLVGVCAEFGVDMDHLMVAVPKSSAGGEAPVKICPAEKSDGTICGAQVHAAMRFCPECGGEFPITEVVEAAIGSLKRVEFNKGTPAQEKKSSTTYRVAAVHYFEHFSRVKEKLLIRVAYTHDFGVLSEYLCLPDYYTGFAVDRAREWWEDRTDEPFPDTVAEFIFLSGNLLKPTHIVAEEDGKFERIVSYKGLEQDYDSVEVPGEFDKPYVIEPYDPSDIPF